MRKIVYASLIVIPLLAACASPRIAKIPDTMSLKEPGAGTAQEKPRAEAGGRDEFKGIDGDQKYSLSVRNADLADVLILLSRKSGQTIIADRDVTGKVTAEIKDQGLKDILASILKPQGYSVTVENGIVRVIKSRLISKTFSLNYIKGSRASTSTMNAAINESVNGGISSAGGSINLNVSSGGATGASYGDSSSSSQQGSVSVKTSGVSDFWSEVTRGLEVIVFGDSGSGKHENGYSRADKTGRKLIVNELAGIIYVKDYSDNMENVQAFLDDVEHSVKKQVLIQAHIVEVSLNDDFSLGIDWNKIAGSGTGPSGERWKFSQNLVPTPPTEVFQIAFTAAKASALLDAMKQQGTLNMLSSPKIATLNNQKAVIKLTTKEVTWIASSIFNAQGNVLANYTTPQINEVGIFLDVTPQIGDRDNVTMQIHPSISELSSTSISPDGKSSAPIIDIREVDTMVEAKNEQTVVIAGLIVDKILETKRGVPLLGDIPYLGWLFSFISHSKQKTELVILITPYVLNDKSIADIRQRHEDRLSKAGRTFFPTP